MNSIDKLMPDGENNVLFGNIIKSDGFCVDFLFDRRADYGQEDDIVNHDLCLEDFTLEEVKQSYRTSFLDPGRKSVYTAVTGLNSQEHCVRRCSTKEYYHLTGSTVFSIELQKTKDQEGITQIESAAPTAKTAKSDTYLAYIYYTLANLNTLFTFYGSHTAKNRFNLYQGRQRAPEIMVNMLLHGDKKYNRKKRNKKKDKKKKKLKPKKKKNKAMPEERKK
jgi:hypothetical protein